MRFTPKNIRKHQQGGEMAAPAEEPMAPEAAGAEEMPQEGGQQDPIMMLAQAAMQALQNQDAQLAFQVCQGLVQLVQQAMGGGQAPQEPEGEPVFRKGGRILHRIKK